MFSKGLTAKVIEAASGEQKIVNICIKSGEK
jgi:hypothetical protein